MYGLCPNEPNASCERHGHTYTCSVLRTARMMSIAATIFATKGSHLPLPTGRLMPMASAPASRPAITVGADSTVQYGIRPLSVITDVHAVGISHCSHTLSRCAAD